MATRTSEVNKFVRQARKAGVDIRRRKGTCHWSVYHDGHRCTTLASSPSDHRWLKNAVADIQRYTGINLRTR